MPAGTTLNRLRSNPAFLLGLSVWVAVVAVRVFRPGLQLSQSWSVTFDGPVVRARGVNFWFAEGDLRKQILIDVALTLNVGR